MVLSVGGTRFSVVAVGSCLVVAGTDKRTVDVLDTFRNRTWHLPPLHFPRVGCSLVTVGSHIAVVGGLGNESSATLPVMDKNTWCFWRLSEPQRNKSYRRRDWEQDQRNESYRHRRHWEQLEETLEWYRRLRLLEQDDGFQDINGTAFQDTNGTCAWKQARTNGTWRGGDTGTNASGVHDVAPCPTTGTQPNGSVAPNDEEHVPCGRSGIVNPWRRCNS